MDLYHFDIMILEQLSTRPQGILYVLMYIFKVVLKNYEKTQKKDSHHSLTYMKNDPLKSRSTFGCIYNHVS